MAFVKQLGARALVVFSGGQDSTVCLHWTLRRFNEVTALSFSYGQRHSVELEAAATICHRLGVKHKILPMDLFHNLGAGALVNEDKIEDSTSGLPNTFVPGRNLIFLTAAAAFATQLSIEHLVTGVCQTDYSGYPDCRDDTIKSLQVTLNLGLASKIVIHTPLMWLSKAESVQLATEEGAMESLAYSHTCYEGSVPPCGHCPACLLRAKGFMEAGVLDPLLQRLKAQ